MKISAPVSRILIIILLLMPITASSNDNSNDLESPIMPSIYSWFGQAWRVLPNPDQYNWDGGKPSYDEWYATLQIRDFKAIPKRGSNLELVTFKKICGYSNVKFSATEKLTLTQLFSSIGIGSLQSSLNFAKDYMAMTIEPNDQYALNLLQYGRSIKFLKEVALVIGTDYKQTFQSAFLLGQKSDVPNEELIPAIENISRSIPASRNYKRMILYHIHPSVDYVILNTMSARFAMLSEGDMSFAALMSSKFHDILFVIKAVVLGDYSYSITYLNGNVVP